LYFGQLAQLVERLVYTEEVGGSSPLLSMAILGSPAPLFFNLMLLHLTSYLTTGAVLFLLGLWGIALNRRNLIVMLMAIELMLLAINFNLASFSAYLDDTVGQLFALLILTVAAAESAIGLAVLVVFYRLRGTVSTGTLEAFTGAYKRNVNNRNTGGINLSST
jgi:NADH-quinone oxidoreductase subunit K